MSWSDLLATPDVEVTLPWLGGRDVHGADRTWKIAGKLPPQHGWYRFTVGGSKKTRVLGPGEPDLGFDDGRECVRGYIVRDRLIPDGAAVSVDPDQLFHQTVKVHLVEPGLERFARGLAARQRDGKLVYVREEFPLGPEDAVRLAWQDQAADLAEVSEVTPALDLAYRWLTWRRLQVEARRQRLERERERAERRGRFGDQMDRVAAVRHGATQDFDNAARAALEVSGATLLDTHRGRQRDETVVTFRFRHQSFTCTVRTHDLAVVDSGICLVDHDTGERGDRFFTLDSLPAVIAEAMDTHRLVVW